MVHPLAKLHADVELASVGGGLSVSTVGYGEKFGRATVLNRELGLDTPATVLDASLQEFELFLQVIGSQSKISGPMPVASAV